MTQDDRRKFIRVSAAAGTGLVISACQRTSDVGPKTQNENRQQGQNPSSADEKATEVTATEDLMREHGVLRRILLVYQAVADNIRTNRISLPTEPVKNAANLFRKFGEDYHEKQLEEAYIFPSAVKNAGGPAAAYIDTLLAQHQRGREVTDYILTVTYGAGVISNSGPQLADVLQSYVRMYENHAAREDTILFPAWKETLTASQLDEMNDRFEDIEHQMFGPDGFEDAVKQVESIEAALGLSDLAQFTAPPPPKQ